MQLKMLEKDVEDIKFYSHTQAVANRTGYRGFADWAEVMVLNALSCLILIIAHRKHPEPMSTFC